MLFFFYGTLLDRDVRQIVLPHCRARLATEPGVLGGWTRVRARYGCFPMVARRPGGRVAGLLVEGVDVAGLYRMAHFEGTGYTVEPLPVATQRGRLEAYVFLPERRGFCRAGGWSLEVWQRRHKRSFLPLARRWMGEFGANSPWTADLSWHARRRIQAIAREAGGEGDPARLRLAA